MLLPIWNFLFIIFYAYFLLPIKNGAYFLLPISYFEIESFILAYSILPIFEFKKKSLAYFLFPIFDFNDLK